MEPAMAGFFRSWPITYFATFFVVATAMHRPLPLTPFHMPHLAQWSFIILTLLSGGVLYGAQDERRARELFIAGTTLQQMERWPEAILEFQESLRYDTSTVTLTAIARCYMRMAKYDRALRFADLAVQADSTYDDALETLAEVYVSTGMYDAAVGTYERIRSTSPTPRQLYTLGRLYEPRDARKAIEVFEELLRKEPSTDVCYQLSELYRRVKDTVGLIRSVERAADLDPSEPYIGAELSRLYVEAGRLADAISLLRSWSDKGATDEEREHVWSSAVIAMLSDTTRVQQFRSDALLLVSSPEASQVHSWRLQTMLGALALRVKDGAVAESRFAEAMRTGGNNPDVPIQIAVAYADAQQPKAAFDVLARVAAVHDRDARFPYYMGLACIQMDQDSASVVLFRHATFLDRTFTDAWVQLGLGFESLDMVDSAEAAYMKVLRLDPDNHLVNNNLAYSLANRGIDLVRARGMAWRAVQQFPSSSAYLDTYAWVLHKMGAHDEAKTYIERAISRGGNATHYEHYGDILEALGILDAAVDAWDRALKLDPDRQHLFSKLARYR